MTNIDTIEASMKIFNQRKLGQWDDVMDDVIQNLKERIS